MHFATKDLPAELAEGQQAELLLEVPCAAVSSWPAETMIEHALGKP